MAIWETALAPRGKPEGLHFPALKQEIEHGWAADILSMKQSMGEW